MPERLMKIWRALVRLLSSIVGVIPDVTADETMHDPSQAELEAILAAEESYRLATEAVRDQRHRVDDLAEIIQRTTDEKARAEVEYRKLFDEFVEAGRQLDEAREAAHTVYPRPATKLNLLSVREREEDQDGHG